nr:tRNA (adenosine(37)-N6)-dimethylallyltransferase MiaA [Phreatobacter sp.]
MAEGHGALDRSGPRAVLIAGPTASGKSALALELAERFRGVVINADSMQVYRDLAIITARPAPDEAARADHRLYGTVDAAENFSVGRWLAAATGELASARETGHLPIVIGGTGLYFKALTQGLSDIPSVPPDVRARIRALGETLTPAELHARLAAVDPETAAGLRPSDPQRLLRALEVLEATGHPLAYWQRAGRSTPILDPADCAAVFLSVDRPWLRQRIDARFDAMMASGAMEEVARLAARNLDPALPAMRAHGVPGLIAHLRGEISRDDAVARGKKDTKAYAKRQETFFRHQLPGFVSLTPDEARGRLTALLQP